MEPRTQKLELVVEIKTLHKAKKQSKFKREKKKDLKEKKTLNASFGRTRLKAGTWGTNGINNEEG